MANHCRVTKHLVDEALQGRGTQLVRLVHAATCKLSAARTHRSQLHVKAVQISGKSSNQANLKFAWSAKFNFVCFRSKTPLLHNTHLIWGSTIGPSFFVRPTFVCCLAMSTHAPGTFVQTMRISYARLEMRKKSKSNCTKAKRPFHITASREEENEKGNWKESF